MIHHLYMDERMLYAADGKQLETLLQTVQGFSYKNRYEIRIRKTHQRQLQERKIN